MWQGLRSEAAAWCCGKNWLIRAPLILFFGYVLIRSLSAPLYQGPLDMFNLGIHELGHLLFGCFGQFMAILGGTFWECAAPFIGMWNFYRQRDFFAMAMCLGWLSSALFHVAPYVADARAMELTLVAPWGGGDGDIIHDWNYLLSTLGLLPYDQQVSFLFWAGGVVSMGACYWTGIWLLLQMKKSEDLRLRS